MTIRKNPMTTEKEINDLIQKGGNASHVDNQLNEPHRLKVKEWIATDPTQPSFNTWILESKQQRLQREHKNENN